MDSVRVGRFEESLAEELRGAVCDLTIALHLAEAETPVSVEQQLRDMSAVWGQPATRRNVWNVSAEEEATCSAGIMLGESRSFDLDSQLFQAVEYFAFYFQN